MTWSHFSALASFQRETDKKGTKGKRPGKDQGKAGRHVRSNRQPAKCNGGRRSTHKPGEQDAARSRREPMTPKARHDVLMPASSGIAM